MTGDCLIVTYEFTAMQPSYGTPQPAAPLPASSGTVPAVPSLALRLMRVYRSRLGKWEKHVLAYLCFAVDKHSGETWVSVETMARDLSLARSTLLKTLARLAKAAWIERRRRPYTSAITRLRPERFTGRTGDADASCPAGRPEEVRPVDFGRLAETLGGCPAETQSVRLSDRPSGEKSSGDDAPLSLLDELRKTYPDWTQKRFDWAIERIRKRAPTPPASVAYWRKSLFALAASLDAEVASCLTELAFERLRNGQVEGVATDLYEAAIAHGLPYDHRVVNTAIDAADARLEQANTLHSELSVGKLRQ